jgi:hypothetical protein
MPSDPDVQYLLDLLEEAVDRSGRSRRDIEAAMGFSHGYLGHLFTGRMQLKVLHIFSLARELGFDGWAFLQQAARARAEGGKLPPFPTGGGVTEAQVRRILLRELELRGLPSPADPAARPRTPGAGRKARTSR